ncbi:hypothetical protein NUW58_g1910 [Xylaria curta]|uniref:Uncharacterized protein n=1 Tax=Xylaria curta TaxID=42375 RepID=A0ACC1PJQ7_9PEZI|nr:hypothetical protein NUW58_g1910 [Xylaria curta]
MKTSSVATLTGAAITPDCRVLPPRCLRAQAALLIISDVPVTMLPMEAPRPLGASPGNYGFPEASAVKVHVNGRILGTRPRRNGTNVGKGHDGPLERTFQTDNPGGGVVIGFCKNRMPFHVVESEVVAVGRHNHFDQSPAESRGIATFLVDDVSSIIGKDRVRRAFESGSEGDLIAHAARHDQDRGFVADQASDIIA